MLNVFMLCLAHATCSATDKLFLTWITETRADEEEDGDVYVEPYTKQGNNCAPCGKSFLCQFSCRFPNS